MRSRSPRKSLKKFLLVFVLVLSVGVVTAGCTAQEIGLWFGVANNTHSNSWLACIRNRESGGDYSINTGNGYYGAYQYLPGTWNSAVVAVDGSSPLADGRPDHHSPYDQDRVTLRYAQMTGGQPWAGDLHLCGRP